MLVDERKGSKGEHTHVRCHEVDAAIRAFPAILQPAAPAYPA